MATTKAKKGTARGAAAKKAAGARRIVRAKGSAQTPQFSDFEPLPPVDVLLRIVQDAVYSRIRHRALVDVLAAGGFDAKAYLLKFRELVERDYRALYAKFILSADDFSELHGSWLEDDEKRYRAFFGFPGEVIEHES